MQDFGCKVVLLSILCTCFWPSVICCDSTVEGSRQWSLWEPASSATKSQDSHHARGSSARVDRTPSSLSEKEHKWASTSVSFSSGTDGGTVPPSAREPSSEKSWKWVCWKMQTFVVVVVVVVRWTCAGMHAGVQSVLHAVKLNRTLLH